MFWGNGDSSRLTEAERETLSHIRRMVETGHVVALNPEQSRLAVEALLWYSRFIAFGHLMQSVRNIGLLVAGLMALWWASKGALTEWVQSLVVK